MYYTIFIAFLKVKTFKIKKFLSYKNVRNKKKMIVKIQECIDFI